MNMNHTEKSQTNPWENEPDKADFEAHGLKCSMRRGPVGAWCGYVGVPKEHPWFGKHYSDQVKVPKEIIERPIDVNKIGAINLFCAMGKSDEIEAGFIDIVLAIDVHEGLTYSRDHVPDETKDGLWWFGFDCSHCDDLSPKYAQKYEALFCGVYRDESFVKIECENLAKQLLDITKVKNDPGT
jgi:hypothetical protein